MDAKAKKMVERLMKQAEACVHGALAIVDKDAAIDGDYDGEREDLQSRLQSAAIDLETR
jgi:hypothetical protein